MNAGERGFGPGCRPGVLRPWRSVSSRGSIPPHTYPGLLEKEWVVPCWGRMHDISGGILQLMTLAEMVEILAV